MNRPYGPNPRATRAPPKAGSGKSALQRGHPVDGHDALAGFIRIRERARHEPKNGGLCRPERDIK